MFYVYESSDLLHIYRILYYNLSLLHFRFTSNIIIYNYITRLRRLNERENLKIVMIIQKHKWIMEKKNNEEEISMYPL